MRFKKTTTKKHGLPCRLFSKTLNRNTRTRPWKCLNLFHSPLVELSQWPPWFLSRWGPCTGNCIAQAARARLEGNSYTIDSTILRNIAYNEMDTNFPKKRTLSFVTLSDWIS